MKFSKKAISNYRPKGRSIERPMKTDGPKIQDRKRPQSLILDRKKKDEGPLALRSDHFKKQIHNSPKYMVNTDKFIE
jgi:hypothetical protein